MTHLSLTIDKLISWLEHDVLNKASDRLTEKEALYDLIVDEFKKLEQIESHRIESMRITLENKKPSALAFVSEMADKFSAISVLPMHYVPSKRVGNIPSIGNENTVFLNRAKNTKVRLYLL